MHDDNENDDVKESKKAHTEEDTGTSNDDINNRKEDSEETTTESDGTTSHTDTESENDDETPTSTMPTQQPPVEITDEVDEHVIVRYLEDEMKSSYIDYSMSVIVQRALPDVRDGLKPVHRRILYSMHESGMSSSKAYKKSARIVGDVLGKYHPHGDTAVYDALVRMAQDFSLRYPLVDGQGNFGSVDGDNAAAMRYTESRMAKIADEMILDIDKDTIDFTQNYDASTEEPTV